MAADRRGTTGYDLAIKLYVQDDRLVEHLPRAKVEEIVLSKSMDAYDGASNGNKSRGGVKRANDM